jgi:hypothetical protein
VAVVELQTGGKRIALPDGGAAVEEMEEVLDDNRRTREVGDGAILSMPVGHDARSLVAGDVGVRR